MAGAPVVVNGEPIEEGEIRAEVSGLRKELESRACELSFEQRLQLRDRAISLLVERRLIFQECRRLGISPTPQVIEEAAAALVPRVDGGSGCRAGTDLTEVRREAERRLTFAAMLARWCRNIAPPKSTEVRDYYRSHQDQFWRPETIHASHLVRNKEGRSIDEIRPEIEAARQRLIEGEDFAKLAAACSDCPENGGDLGFFARGVMVEEFDAIVFSAPLREVTPVFETRFGVHIAMVHERRTEGIVGLTEVGGNIAEALHRAKQDREVGRQLDALRRKAVIQVAA